MISTKAQIDTGDTTMCAHTASGADNYCVLAGTDITITALLRGTGPKPLVLIASGTITSSVAGVIDVGSHRVREPGEPEDGAGRNPAVCDPGTVPKSAGGGAGGSFLGTGGNGADGATAGTAGGIAALKVNTVTALRGGCPGQAGQGGEPGAGGLGGGAVFLIAGTSITLAGAVNAAGESGDGGQANTSGGGGGGAGGMIGLDAPIVSVGLLLANGGGGGEGSREGNVALSAGSPGNDPSTVVAAQGGSGTLFGGDGGAGSAGAAAGSGTPGDGGTSGNNGNSRGGGGGGGGGAGIVKISATATLTKDISPAGTP
jgi:hypothetical protein